MPFDVYEMAHQLKLRKYLALQEDLENAGWKVELMPFEIGSRGHVKNCNRTAIIKCLRRNHMKMNNNNILKNLSKI